MTDLLDITLSNERDRQPLQMVSGEQVARWRRIEAAARVAANNRGGAVGGVRQALDALVEAITGSI